MTILAILAGLAVALAAVAGVALTVLTLPGIWLTLVVALLCWWWMGAEFYSPWTIGVALALGVLAEAIEFAASAAGAAKAGGGRSGAIGSIAGALVGAIAGSLVLPVIGTIAGGVIGAGLGAVAGERGIARRTWREAAKVGQGAMVGRFISLIVKTVLAVAIGVILTVGAFVP
jgi:uncharacterized protein YqgC (DUF456 family)